MIGIPTPGNPEAKPVTVILDIVTDLQISKEICLFAVDFDVSSDVDIPLVESETKGKFVQARTSLFMLNEKESQYVSQVSIIFYYIKTFKYSWLIFFLRYRQEDLLISAERSISAAIVVDL